MSDALATASDAGAVSAGPLESLHLSSRLYRNVAGSGRVTATHWHIAWANGLGWGFDGMDGAILALVAPLLMKEFAIDLATYRSGVQTLRPDQHHRTVLRGRGLPTGSAVATSWR